jgi:hypothetical protein
LYPLIGRADLLGRDEVLVFRELVLPHDLVVGKSAGAADDRLGGPEIPDRAAFVFQIVGIQGRVEAVVGANL